VDSKHSFSICLPAAHFSEENWLWFPFPSLSFFLFGAKSLTKFSVPVVERMDDICLRVLEAVAAFELDQVPLEVIDMVLQGQADFEIQSVPLDTLDQLIDLLPQMKRSALLDGFA